MIKRFIDKYMCLHTWTSHSLKNIFREDKTVEILICEKCGKIHKLEY